VCNRRPLDRGAQDRVITEYHPVEFTRCDQWLQDIQRSRSATRGREQLVNVA
jgi:hypothetical protein